MSGKTEIDDNAKVFHLRSLFHVRGWPGDKD